MNNNMKNFTKFLNINPKRVKYLLPAKPKTQDMIDCLINNGFEELDYNDYFRQYHYLDEILPKIVEIAKETNKAAFYVKQYKSLSSNQNFYSMRFWNGGDINKNNPIVYVRTTKDGHEVRTEEAANYAFECYDGRIENMSYNDWEEAAKEINKYFDFGK